jgi:hypothetical protein
MNVGMQVLGLLLTVLGAGGGLGSLLLVRRQRGKLSADTAHVLSAAAITMVKPLEERLSATEAEVRQLKRMMLAWRRAIMDPRATIERVRELVARESI